MFKYVLLALLAQQPRHGYELKVVFDKTMGSLWPPINVGQIYTTLARLERDGLVKEQPSAPDARRDKHVYELTAAGQAALRGWLAESNDNTPVKNRLIVKLVFAQLSGLADLRALLARQRRHRLHAAPTNWRRTRRTRTAPTTGCWACSSRAPRCIAGRSEVARSV
jgi:DNA-binding PadR family transcriptional regulator